MDIESKSIEFDVLGFKVKFKKDDPSRVAPEKVVNHVIEEANKIMKNSRNLDLNEASILVALKMAQEKMTLEKEYRENIFKVHSEALEAIKLVENITTKGR